MRWDEIDSQVCSVARSLSIVGDRWTLLILRDCFLGVRRFDALQLSLGIPRHRLSDRLSKLVEHGVLRKELYQDKPPRYEYRLTEKGLDLYPVLLGLARWGDKWEADADGAPVEYVHINCGHVMTPTLVCDHCDQTIDARSVKPRIGPGLKQKFERGEATGFSADDLPPVLAKTR